MTDTQHPWTDTSLEPRERAELLVAAMSLEQKIQQLHGNMETIDIYGLSNDLADSEEMDQLAAQIRIDRHVAADERLGIPRFRITNGPVGVGMGDGTPSPKATSLPMTIGLAAGFDLDLAHDWPCWRRRTRAPRTGTSSPTWSSAWSTRAARCRRPTRSRRTTPSTPAGRSATPAPTRATAIR